jgi:hypothetical protein
MFMYLTLQYRSAIAHREQRLGKSEGKEERDVIYNTDGRGAPKVKEPGSRWRWEPFAIGTDG